MRPTLSIRSRRLAALLMGSALFASSIQTAAAAGPQRADPSTLKEASVRPVQIGGAILGDMTKAAHRDGKVAIVVQLNSASVASYTGGVKGFAATNPKARGKKTIDLTGSDTVRYRSYLKTKQDAFTQQLASKVKGSKVSDRYDLILNAVAVTVPDDDVAAVAKLPGVKAVYPDTIEQVQTDTTPGFLGAPTVWANLGGQESAGEGVIVGVLDTGIWPEHPSFADPDPSGKAYAPPPAAPDGSRACQFGTAPTPGDGPFTCNNKLIGAARFMDTYDAFGAGTRAGREQDAPATTTAMAPIRRPPQLVTQASSASIFGIAARGHLRDRAARVRGDVQGLRRGRLLRLRFRRGRRGRPSATASTSSTSRSAAGRTRTADISELAFLDAFNAGVFVAASAGNGGPGPDTTEHRGPWVTAVGASTGPRAFVDTVHLTSTDGATLDLAGVSLTPGVGPAPVVVNTNAVCDAAAAPGSFTGKIVVCKRGNPIGRVADGFNVLQGGAAGMILYNQSAAVTDQETDNHFLPASHIQFSQGQSLLAFLGAHPGVQATISQGVKGTQQADVMASFSSRGGPAQSLGVSKPDITAPGVQILAGAAPLHVDVASGPQGELFQSIAGTSMSSPHIAGSAALIKDLHPTWTPGQIKSALMTTAKTDGVVKEDGTTPADAFDDGSGRVDLNVAGDPGLTFDATGADFITHEDDLYTTNYPSIYHPTCPGWSP